jgi:hypothetical protein
MNKPPLFRKTEERTFFAHHMLLHASSLAITDAEATELGRFNNCLSAMVMTALAVEALANAVGTRVVEDWPTFESLRPSEKIDLLVDLLSILRDETKEPWTTLRFLGGFRNDIAHPKPEEVTKEVLLPEIGLSKSAFEKPLSALEREITLGNAKRAYAAVHALKGLLTDALPPDARFGIYADMWHGSTTLHEA